LEFPIGTFPNANLVEGVTVRVVAAGAGAADNPIMMMTITANQLEPCIKNRSSLMKKDLAPVKHRRIPMRR
jgi:hypothetical protein